MTRVNAPEPYRVLLVTLSLFLAVGCAPPGRPSRASRPVPAEEVEDFGTLYATHCSGCHGTDGKLGPAPPLNDPIFLAIVPDTELVHVISNGRTVTPEQKTPMPAFRLGKGVPLTSEQDRVWAELKAEKKIDPRQKAPLTVTQVKALAEGIRQRWGTATPAAGSIPPYLAPKGASGANMAAGAHVFARACAGCHGTQGKGGTYGDQSVGAINDRAFLALISDQALRRYAITGRPDLGMPAFDGKDGRAPDFRPLTSTEIDDLVAHLASWRLGGLATKK